MSNNQYLYLGSGGEPEYWSKSQVSSTQSDVYYNLGNIGIGVSIPPNTLSIDGNCSIGTTPYSETQAPTDGMIIKGNVGIGTISPSYKLDVNGDLNIQNGSLLIDGSPFSSSQWVGSSNNIYYNVGNVGIGKTPSYKLDVSGNLNINGSLYQNGSIFNGSKWTNTIGGILYNGNIGINKSPSEALDVSGNAIVNGNFNINGSLYQNGTLFNGSKWTSTGNNISYNTGFVGIGKTATEALDVSGNTVITGNATINNNLTANSINVNNLTVSGVQTIINTNVGTTERLEITNDGTGPALKITQSGTQPIADFCDDVSSNVVFRIADGGNVGIGVTSPAYKLDVSGNVNIKNGSLLLNGSPFSGSQWTTSSNNLYYNTGNVGIGLLLEVSLMVLNGQIQLVEYYTMVILVSLNHQVKP